MVFVKDYFPFNSVPYKWDISFKWKLTNASCKIFKFFFLVPEAATLLGKCAFKELLVNLKVKLSSEIENKLLYSFFALNGAVNCWLDVKAKARHTPRIPIAARNRVAILVLRPYLVKHPIIHNLTQKRKTAFCIEVTCWWLKVQINAGVVLNFCILILFLSGLFLVKLLTCVLHLFVFTSDRLIRSWHKEIPSLHSRNFCDALTPIPLLRFHTDAPCDVRNKLNDSLRI